VSTLYGRGGGGGPRAHSVARAREVAAVVRAQDPHPHAAARVHKLGLPRRFLSRREARGAAQRRPGPHEALSGTRGHAAEEWRVSS
jgi:hypothetical protein